MHRESRKTFDAPVSWRNNWFPDCFSVDGKQILADWKVADLAESMQGLDFKKLPGLVERRRTFLGFPTRLERGKKSSWHGMSPAEGQFGTVEWSDVRATKYESLTKGQVKSSFLRITPPGRNFEVAWSLLLEAERKRSKKAGEKLPVAMRKMLADLSKRPTVVRLAQLSVSPDQKFLAGVADVSGRPYGVLIPLGRGGYVAKPFAKNVYGKIVWSRDSKAVYFYAQPEVGTGNGTIHRLDVTGVEISLTTKRTEVSKQKLDAPSDSELRQARYDRVKEVHYEQLTKIFSSPQTIIEFQSQWGFTKSGHVIKLFGVGFRTTEQFKEYEKYVTDKLLDRPLTFKLPSKQDFLQNYIPSARTGVYSDTRKYPWPTIAGTRSGEIPVLIYDQGLVNSKFRAGNALANYK